MILAKVKFLFVLLIKPNSVQVTIYYDSTIIVGWPQPYIRSDIKLSGK